jgi:hypothetical protein
MSKIEFSKDKNVEEDGKTPAQGLSGWKQRFSASLIFGKDHGPLVIGRLRKVLKGYTTYLFSFFLILIKAFEDFFSTLPCTSFLSGMGGSVASSGS